MDEVFRLSAQQPAKRAFYRWLEQRFGNLAGINRQLGTGFADEVSFLSATNVPAATSALAQARDGFLAVIAERYFSIPAKALREVDPDHLVLGCRFAGQVPKPVLAAAGRYNDVFTINTYPQVDFENIWQPDGTGGVVEAGKGGALFDRIESGGLSLGRLVFAVHQKVNGQDVWVESTRIIDLEMEEQQNAWVVEVEVEHPAASSGPAGYRARVQAVVFKHRGLAIVRPLWVESLDSRNWQLAEAFWFCRSAIGGSPDQDIVGGPDVPSYYRRAQFITDTKLGGCFGSLSQSASWQVTFWTDPQGGIHPDSRLAVTQEMPPGKRWRPEPVPFLWVYGSSQAKAWEQFSKLSQQSQEVLVQPPIEGAND